MNSTSTARNYASAHDIDHYHVGGNDFYVHSVHISRYIPPARPRPLISA
jgi:hypothetical protein